MATSPARIHPHRQLEAAGYIRVSLQRQAEGHSPEVQREAIKKLAAQEGYALTMIEEDHERGSTVTRVGYQRIIEAVRQGTIHAVLVFLFDRWGRDGAEWLLRAREFDRLGVPILSVQEGRDQGGLMRFIRAGMAEEYSRQLATRVKPAHERAVRLGTHIGPTPLGFSRQYPAWDGQGRRPSGRLVPDEATARVIREMFARYGQNGWSVRDLAHWLNGDEQWRALAPRHTWYAPSVQRILRNPVYKGSLRYNRHPRGRYERAQPGDEFTVEGTHEPLVDPTLWAEVQRRLDAASHKRTYNRGQTRTGRPLALGSGLFRCLRCGGPLYPHTGSKHDKPALYVCLRRHNGTGCTATGCIETVAHAALLSEVRRLRGTPWTPQAEARLVGPEGQNAAERSASIRRALEQEQERMRRNVRRMNDLDDPTPEEIAAFRQVGAEIAARIRALETEAASVSQHALSLPSLQAIHEKLVATELGPLVDGLQEQGNTTALRELVLEFVESAIIVERRPARPPVWARVEVTWTQEVQTLLDAGLLTLDAPEEAPYILTGKDLARKRRRERYLATGK